jgi:hypothetical protein
MTSEISLKDGMSTLFIHLIQISIDSAWRTLPSDEPTFWVFQSAAVSADGISLKR